VVTCLLFVAGVCELCEVLRLGYAAASENATVTLVTYNKQTYTTKTVADFVQLRVEGLGGLGVVGGNTFG
jgi:hypothetical protein